MFDRIQTILVVTLLAILIWLYAEAQNPALPLVQDITIELIPPTGTNLRVTPNANPRTQITLAGPNAALEDLKRQLQIQNNLQLTLGELTLPTTPGDYNEPIINYLQQHPLFNHNRIRILDIQPNVLTFTVFAMAQHTFNIETAPIPNLQTDGPIEINPPTISATIPADLLNTLDQDTLKIIAVPKLSASQTYEPGGRYTVEATLTIPSIADASVVEFDPNQIVELTFTVHTTRTELAVPNVPIKLVLPPGDQNRYDITISETLIAELKIAGPSDLINEINAKTKHITGEAIFSSDELTQQITTKQISFDHLPDTLTVLSDPITINVTITRRENNQTNE